MTAPTEVPVETGGTAPARRRRWLIAAVAVTVALVLTAIGAFRWGSAGTPEAVRPTATPKPSATPLTTAQVYRTLQPSVVVVQTLTGTTVTSTGSGVVANADGIVLTAFHVVKGGGTIRLTFADGTQSAASVKSADEANDIAALEPATLPTVVVPAVLGNSGRLAIGDDVVAIGNPLGLVLSASAGVVSGLNRSAAGEDGLRLAGLIQFDAAVNPGSSGGPLVNARGETIGIVVALANPTSSRTFIGIGFAVPIGTAVAGGGGPGPQQ